MQKKITTFLTFDDRAEEAVAFYTSVFEGSRILSTNRYGEAGPAPPGTFMSATFELAGQEFVALNGGPSFSFAQGISLFVTARPSRRWTSSGRSSPRAKRSSPAAG